MDPNELRQQRAALVAQARQILETAEAARRDLTAEETQEYDRIMGEVDGLKARIDRIEQMNSLDQDLRNPQRDPQARQEPDRQTSGRTHPRASAEYQAAFTQFLRYGPQSLSHDQVRALQSDDDTRGGYMVAPQQFAEGLIAEIDNMLFIRQWAHTETLTAAESLGAVSREQDLDDADWTSELRTGRQDDELRLGKRELRPHPLAKRVLVSNTLLRRTSGRAESLVRERLAYKFGVTHEKGFLRGDGLQKPLGVFTASTDGISTARDISTGNTATEIRTDGLIEAKFSIKQQYWPRLRWIFHRDGVKQIRKLKDGEGQYIWRPGIGETAPDTILDSPYAMSEYAPNTFTTGQYVGIIGDFQFYWIVDALDMQVQRLVELYAETNQVGFIGRLETDGMPVLQEAFSRVTLA